jgi:hypothetical protein
MKTVTIITLAALLTVGAVQAQDVERKIELKVAVAGDDDGAPSVVHWVSDDADLDSLAVGETRVLPGESGNDVTVTRTASGMQFEIEGETIIVPDMDMDGHGSRMAFVDAAAGSGDIDVQVFKTDSGHENVNIQVMGDGPHMIQAHHPDGVTIISGTPLDDSVKESIRSVLISAGNNEEVIFIDGSDDGRQVRVIKKRVEIAQ